MGPPLPHRACLVAFGEEASKVSHLESEIVRVRFGTELDLLVGHRRLMLLGVLALLGVLILELAVVHDLANRRHRLRADLDEIEATLLGDAQRLGGVEHSELTTVGADDAHLRHADAAVYASTLLRDRTAFR